MNIHKPTTRFLLFSIALCGGVVAVCATTWVFLGVVRDDLTMESAALVDARREHDNRATARLFVNQVSAERRFVEEALADTEHAVSLFERLEETARGAGIIFSIVSVGEPGPLSEDRAGPKQVSSQKTKTSTINPETLFLPVSLRGEGSFAAVYRFLEKLEVFPYMLTFLSVELIRNDEDRVTAPGLAPATGEKRAARGAWVLQVELAVPLRASMPTDSKNP